MITRRQHAPHRWTALLAVTILTPAFLAAQPERTGRAKPTSATLPESNEALLLASRVEGAVQAGDYRLAIELLERMMELPGGLVAEPASRTYYPPRRQAFQLFARLPEQAVELYRQLYDAEVSARFHEATAVSDVGALRELFRKYRLSSAWPAIGAELAAQLLDRAAFGEAIEVLRELERAGARSGPGHTAQLAVALASAGAVRSADRLLTELESDPELAAQTEWRARLGQLRRWLATGPGDQAVLADGGRRAFAPSIAAGAVWTQPLSTEVRARRLDDGEDLAEAIDLLRRLPLHQPVLGEGTLLVRLRGRLWAFDAGSLVLRWSVVERPAVDVTPTFAGRAPAADRGDEVRPSPEAERLLSDCLGHTVAVGFGKVYTIEGLAPFDGDQTAFGQRALGVSRESGRRNELVARDIDTGRAAWRTSADPASVLFEVAFQNVPLVVGNRLVVPFQRGSDLNLAVIDPEDGNLIREVPLIGPPTHFGRQGGRCLIVSDETSVYVCTGNGVAIALARDDLTWKWATVYPSTLAERLGQLWWQPAREATEWGVDPPLLVDDLLIVAPVDSPDIFALDRFDGHERWRTPRREYPFLVGTVGDGLVVGGQALACLDLGDPLGRPPRWKSVPLQVTGRAAIRDNRVYVPTRAGIVVLDGQTGKVLSDQRDLPSLGDGLASASVGESIEARDGLPLPAARSSAPDRAANLFIVDDALFSVSPGRVVKYPDPRRVRARIAAVSEEVSTGGHNALIQAWLDALEGRYEAAFTCLRDARFVAPGLEAARERLLSYVFLGLSRGAATPDAELSWLRRALELAESPDVAVRLAVAIGAVLESEQQWQAALEHYRTMLLRPEVGYFASAADAHHRIGGWLHAVDRIRAVRDRVPRAFAQGLIDRTLRETDEPTRRAVVVQRLHVALENKPADDRLKYLLTIQKLPPELKIRYLPKAVPVAVPAALRRRLCLERWDTQVSLGLLDLASEDRDIWRSQFADAETNRAPASQPVPFEPLSPEDERERVRAIDLAFRKLEQARGVQFTQRVARQWKIERAELLLDPRRPLTGLRPWILVANLGTGRIELINVYKHQHPQRQTEDRLVANKLRPAAAYDPEAEGRRFSADQGRRTTWPVVVHEHLAAVPVTGGLVCVGLGPERYAGRRQWEYAVPEWNGIAPDFTDRAVGGRHGLYFTPRRDRVVLVGWSDGRLWWQLDLPDTTIERLYLLESSGLAAGSAAADDELVIVSDDRRVWVAGGTFGRPLTLVETEIPVPRRIDVVDDTIVVWGPASVLGVSGRTLRQIWQRPCGPVVDTVTAGQRPWVAYRTHGTDEWRLLDAHRGEPVFAPALGVFESISAIGSDAERIFVAGRAAPSGPRGEARGGTGLRPINRLVAIDPRDGTRLWQREVATGVPVNATQLAAHPDYIPVLLARAEEDRAAEVESDLPAIQLINKDDGELGERLSIEGDYRPDVAASCDVYMLATPTRMIVQIGGNLIAYGDSPLRSAP